MKLEFVSVADAAAMLKYTVPMMLRICARAACSHRPFIVLRSEEGEDDMKYFIERNSLTRYYETRPDNDPLIDKEIDDWFSYDETLDLLCGVDLDYDFSALDILMYQDDISVSFAPDGNWQLVRTHEVEWKADNEDELSATFVSPVKAAAMLSYSLPMMLRICARAVCSHRPLIVIRDDDGRYWIEEQSLLRLCKTEPRNDTLLDEIEPCDNWFENEGWAFEQSDRLDILCGTQIEENFSLDDLSLYSDEIANEEPEEDLIMDFDDEPEAFDIMHHEVPMNREEYKRVYGNDYMDEGDITE